MNKKFFKSAVLVIGLAFGSNVFAEELSLKTCETIAELASLVGKNREAGMSKHRQLNVAEAAVNLGASKDVGTLHKGMIDNCYKNQLNAEEMSVIYYLACKKNVK
jgi:hypothetical protein